MEEKRYRAFGDYLKERFGCRVSKVTVSAGFTCPNRDGTRGTGGCIYCNNAGFNPNLRMEPDAIQEQVRKGIDFFSRKRNARKFIVYFQPYTNTYGPVDELRKIYDSALMSGDIVGISIGTRPDCLPDDVLDLIESYAERYMVWLEIGLQSMHQKTLDLVNRGHDLGVFINAVSRAKRKRGILLCTHIIHGLPGESPEKMMQTVRLVSALGLDGIKFHNLHIMRDTPLEKMHAEGRVKLLTMDEYVRLVADSLELLPPDTVVLRLSGDAPGDLLVAPEWCRRKLEIQERVNSTLIERGTRQGSRYSNDDAAEFMEKFSGKWNVRNLRSRTFAMNE